MSILDESFAAFRRIMETNLFGAWLGIHAIAPVMKRQGSGAIVNVSSTSGLRGYAGHTSYGTSKWALRGLTKTAAKDLGQFGIRVNSIHPGGIEETGMYPVPETEEEKLRRYSMIPLGPSRPCAGRLGVGRIPPLREVGLHHGLRARDRWRCRAGLSQRGSDDHDGVHRAPGSPRHQEGRNDEQSREVLFLGQRREDEMLE